MKNVNKVIGIVFLLSFFLIFSCKKDKEIINPFPPNTETGANTFMFRVNGGDIINSQVGYLAAKPRISVFYNHDDPYFNGDNYFELWGGTVYLNTNKYIRIYIKNMTFKGSYKLSTNDNSASYDDLNPTEQHYYTDANNTGELNITKLDTANHIISGTFTFKAKQWCLSGNCNEVVTIDGQFDVTYKPNNGVNYY